MGLDRTAICNTAIGMCGSTDFIQSIDDSTSPAARRCKQFFRQSVLKVLRKHDWNCATDTTELARLTASPTFKYDHAYAVPADCVKIINVYGDKNGYNSYDRWQVRSGHIETDLDSAYLEYIKEPTDYSSLDILLADAIAGELAMLLAATIVRDPEVFSMLSRIVQMRLAEAKAIDTLENKYIYQEASVWNDARRTIV